MYKIDDYVIYGMQGVCKIKDITEVDFSESGNLYYKLVPECDKSGEIYVSVKNGEKKMRELVSQDQAEEMIKEMPTRKGKWISDDRERERVYKQAIMGGDYDQIMEIMVGISKRRKNRMKQGKRQTELDDRIFRNTKKVFFGELAVVLKKDIDSVEKEILTSMK